jgi:deoxyinosine 3'endonuclease (endonuclease V)
MSPLSPTASGKPRGRKPRTLGLAAQTQIWNLEQEVIAALVRVPPDPPIDDSVMDGQHNPLFHLIRDNHRDGFSFSTAPELYGGVDVSFAAPPPTSSSSNDQDDDGIMEEITTSDAKQPGVAVETTDEQAVAVYVIVDRRTMTVVYYDHLFFHLDIPYIPTYLAFREIAPLEELVQRQIQNLPQVTPQAILVDGNGILHPRHAGIACFLGTRTDIPTIGIGKSLLYYQGCGWTRETLEKTVDGFVKGVHAAVGQNQNLAMQLSRYRGLIMKKKKTSSGSTSTSSDHRTMQHGDGDVAMHPIVATTTGASSAGNNFDRKQALQDLAPFCCGLAVPLTAVEDANHSDGADDDDSNNNDNPPKVMIDEYIEATRFPVLGCALVGHGGQIAATSKSAPKGGSSKPIFVSVGHKLSLQESVQVAASLSLARIPEPIRQADLYGRDLMRQRAATTTPTS